MGRIRGGSGVGREQVIGRWVWGGIERGREGVSMGEKRVGSISGVAGG